MQKYADYIKQIEIDSLWSGTKHILWNLDRRVNILSGVNGVGKSTILNKVVKGLSAGGEFPSHLLKGVHLKVEPEEAKWIRFDVIRSADRPLLNSEMISKVDLTLVTELDWQLFQLQRKYLDYQVNIGNRIIAVLQSGEPDAAQKAQALTEPKRMFQDIVDHHPHCQRDQVQPDRRGTAALSAVGRREADACHSAHCAGGRQSVLCALHGRA